STNTIAKIKEESKGGFKMQIGERIRCLRTSKGLTQHDLAQAIHISSSFMNRIEKGSSTVSIEYVCSIAKVLNVTPQDILCDIFVTPETASISEQIKLLSEKLPPDKQLLLLNTLEFMMTQSNLL
uniref:helix-turn-helix domain-containing protein n=2 Tax=Mediterraneibacter gnavus TaxID=33038 RepID=UPI0034A1A3F4